MTRRVCLAAVLALVAAGCGGGSEPDATAPAKAAEGAGDRSTATPPSPPPTTAQPAPSAPAMPPAAPAKPPPAQPLRPPAAPAPGRGGVRSVTTPNPAASVYALPATRRCLSSRGAIVGPVSDEDDQLRALADVAQQTSVLIRFEGGVVGLAIERQQANAALLTEVLRMPGSPYRIEQHVNAVLLYRPFSRRAAAAVRTCLRG